MSLLMVKRVMHTCIFKYVLKRVSFGNFGSVVVDLLFYVLLIVCGEEMVALLCGSSSRCHVLVCSV